MTTNWRRSSTCQGGGCVEVAGSSSCDSGACVEVALGGGLVRVRDSKNPSGPVLVYAADDFAVLVREATIRARPECVAMVGVGEPGGDLFAWVGRDDPWQPQMLLFTSAEIREFAAAYVERRGGGQRG